MLRDALTALLLLAGGFFCFVAALGVLRMPDTYIRMHASSKAGTLGCGLVLAAVAVHFGDIGIGSRATIAIAFLLLTAPAGAHMIGRAAYRTGVPLWQRSVVDEWRDAEQSPPDRR
ncbi:MAG: Na+/H+ antiporter subunit G [Proteobacteria bacterium]|nr:MAG: Na+/H+ antiporter subunit G [Pseudomonadota bacterium]